MDAETRVGAEILSGLIRFRGCVLPFPSPIFGIDGDLRNAAVAASALRCTSSAREIGSMLDDGESGDNNPPGLDGIPLAFIGIPVGVIGSGMDVGLRGMVGLVGIVRAGGVTGAVCEEARCKESERLGLNGLMGASTGRMGDSSSDMSGMMEIWGAGTGPASESSAPNKASARALFRRIGLDCSMSAT